MGTHKPVVSTWGVFERPKDMSKAFGGGRDPTLKRLDPDERRRRDEETKAILNRWDRSREGTSRGAGMLWVLRRLWRSKY